MEIGSTAVSHNANCYTSTLLSNHVIFEFAGSGVRGPSSGVMLRHANQPRPVSRKISKNSVNNRPCLSNEVASLDDLAVRALIFRAKQAQS